MKEFFASSKGKIAAAAVGILLVAAIILLATTGAGASSTTRGIGLDKSIAVALADAGLKQDQVTGLQGHFDRDGSIDAYDVSFQANGFDYEYSIKAADGSILECSIEAPDGRRVTAEQALDIGPEKALAAALKHAGVKESDAELTKSKKDQDDGRIVYEFDFIKGDTKYEYQIDGATGSIDEFSKEVIASAKADAAKSEVPKAGTATGSSNSTGNAGTSSSAGGSGSSDYIGVDKAKSIALKDAGLNASAVTFTRAKLDRDDGRSEYEIDLYTADREYDYEIDAASGKILDRESEPLDDWDDDDEWDD